MDQEHNKSLQPAQLPVYHKPYTDEELRDLFLENSAGFDYRFLKLFRFLEHNVKFQEWLKKMREKANIPAQFICFIVFY